MQRYRVIRNKKTGEEFLPVTVFSGALKHDPILNKGSAFTESERDELGLRGLLPPSVSTMHQQLERVYENYSRQPNDLERHLYLINLQDRNETLFYRLLLEHLEEMLPIIYTPTIAMACEKFSHIYRRARGLYITPSDSGRMKQLLKNAPYANVAVIVATDGEGILGIGDQGAGGIGISIGKLTLYTVGAGIHPTRCLPICIDVGTNNEELQNDPLYLGVQNPRLKGEKYFHILDSFVDGVLKAFPHALLQWEDFSRQNAWAVLERHRDRIGSFNDDIQGTGAVALAGLLVVSRITGMPLREHRFCIFGAGAAGSGIISTILIALRNEGLSRSEALNQIVALDSKGPILKDRNNLEEYKKAFAGEHNLVAGWQLENPGSIGLADVVRNFKPTILIGTSGQGGAFTREILREMETYTERPAVFAFSNPTTHSEISPEKAVSWTRGQALIATGSPFNPVEFGGRRLEISQGNNVLFFPGLGLGTVASRARRITDEMILAAAKAIASEVTEMDEKNGRLFPPVQNIRQVSRTVALAVAKAAYESGAAHERDSKAPREATLSQHIEREIWYPEYVPYKKHSV